MLVFLSMLSAGASETCGDTFAIHGTWSLPTAEVVLDHGVLTVDGVPVGKRVVEPPAIHGDTVAFVEERDDNGLFDLVVLDVGRSRIERPITNQTPKQLAFSADGRSLAYVNGATGITAVYVLPLGGEPRQLTNRDLVRTPGHAPEGFTPSPSNGLRFVGTHIEWDADGETYRIDANGGAR